MKIRTLRWRSYKKKGGPKIGPRCRDYGPGCFVCESYRFLDKHGRFPTFEEVNAVHDAILGNPSGSLLPIAKWKSPEPTPENIERAMRGEFGVHIIPENQIW